MFLIFIVFSLVTWFMNKLSKTYTTTIVCNAFVEQLPQNRFLYDPSPMALPVTVSSHGFRLLGMQLFGKDVSLNAEKLATTNDRDYLIADEQLGHLVKQFPSDVQILSLNADTLFIKTSYSDSKYVKVIPNIEVAFKPGYGYVGTMQLEKDSIQLIGPKAQLDAITEIYTEATTLKDVADDIALELTFESPASKLIKTVETSVAISAKVDRYTEKEVEVPITIRDLPEGTTIRLFPNSVNIIYTVGLKDIDKIDPTEFTVECYYNEGDSPLEAVLTSRPSSIAAARIENSKIDYLIKE